MKKFFLCLLALLLLAAQIPVALAAGTASVKGPGTVRAGDTITVTFSAGGDIYGGSGSVSFDSSQLTLQKYAASLGSDWKVEFRDNRFTFENEQGTLGKPLANSTAIFKATFKVSKDLTPGTTISVAVKSIELSHGSSDTSIAEKSYSATIAPPLSDNCNLASMTVSNATISPAFSTGTTSYTASVPFTTDTLKVSATAQDSDAKVSVKNTKLTAGATTTVSVTVTAANGDTKTYSIKVKRAQDPNYIPESNTNLQELTVQDYPLSPAFSPDVTQYYVWLPYEAESVSISGKAAGKKAKVAVDEAAALVAGKGNNIAVTVTAEDGTQRIYTVTAVRAPAPADTEAFLNPQPEQVPQQPEVTPPTDPAQPAAPAPAQPTAPQPQTHQVPLAGLICASAACLALGILLGIVIKHLTDKKKYLS